MTAATSARYPFTPTQDSNGVPTVCHVCGRRAHGIGAGDFRADRQGNVEPRWLCTECILILDQIRSVRRLDIYETKALDGGVDAVGDYVMEIGKTELSEFTELEQRMLIKAAWQGTVARLRQLLEAGDAPF